MLQQRHRHGRCAVGHARPELVEHRCVRVPAGPSRAGHAAETNTNGRVGHFYACCLHDANDNNGWLESLLKLFFSLVSLGHRCRCVRDRSVRQIFLSFLFVVKERGGEKGGRCTTALIITGSASGKSFGVWTQYWHQLTLIHF